MTANDNLYRLGSDRPTLLLGKRSFVGYCSSHTILEKVYSVDNKEKKMAVIDDLSNVSILEMSDEELLNHLQKIRKSRRTPKKFTKNKRTTLSKKKSTDSLVSGLTSEQAAQLLAKLEG